ncbi:hypothetical protein [Nocardia panacis]|uniref:hypothetical protein n=1 Tax=Nocardia panacis TaxID=2340916 RepID=UPI0011C3CAA2|nr:hypothetical protein [Nocardia panacis]
MIGDTTIVTPPLVCGYADVELAHEQMRTHRACRIVRCAWKAAAYYTLVAAGRLTPQSLTPRERAAARGIEFPPLDSDPPNSGGPTYRTLREVLDKLSELALPTSGADGNGHPENP